MSSGVEIEVLTRTLATAAIVVGITLAVERLGPRIGGALAGLPIVIGPAFFFLLQDHSAAFSIDIATATLTSLAATQAFLLGYIAVAARSRAAIGAATLAWLTGAWLLSWLPQSPWLSLSIFVAATVVARRLAARFVRPHAISPAKGSWMLLFLRGSAAGLLVSIVTLTADSLGTVRAGFLIAYPIGLTVIAVTVHQRSGADVVVATLRSVMLGISSLAAFAFTLSVTLTPLGPLSSFTAALAAGVAMTTLLVRASAKSV